jgi:endogenous inhibitor of DNA gyrase (YacG/DUF329 family)
MRKVRCPQCGKETEYSPENAFRPFCCERCRLIDLGQWADEKYKVPLEKESDPSAFSQGAQEHSDDQED